MKYGPDMQNHKALQVLEVVLIFLNLFTGFCLFWQKPFRASETKFKVGGQNKNFFQIV